MKVLKIYCQYGRRYCRCGNFGDNLTKILIENLTNYKTQRVESKNADVIGVGSILQDVLDDFDGIIWTSGFGHDRNFKKFPKAKIIALRGKKTLEGMGLQNDDIVLGDGGLLCYILAGSDIKKKYKLGIIPHYIDKKVKLIKTIADKSNEITIVDICGGKEVIERVQECEYILSSSLHGLILSDSLNIPNDWIELSNRVLGMGFKFRDYYSVFGIENKTPLILKPEDNLDSIMPRLQDYKRPGIDQIKKQLLESIKQL